MNTDRPTPEQGQTENHMSGTVHGNVVQGRDIHIHEQPTAEVHGDSRSTRDGVVATVCAVLGIAGFITVTHVFTDPSHTGILGMSVQTLLMICVASPGWHALNRLSRLVRASRTSSGGWILAGDVYLVGKIIALVVKSLISLFSFPVSIPLCVFWSGLWMYRTSKERRAAKDS